MINMILKELLNKKNEWQNETVNSLKRELIFKTDIDINLNADSTSQRLAVIYGMPQIGKTTLILNIIGIKQEFISDVSSVLRAGLPKGNSSTSTAILYRRSKDDRYGIACRSFEENNENSEAAFFEESKDLEKKLKDIRSQVESNRRRTDILHIFIPNKYFESESDLNILDTPGLGSRNSKEDRHTSSIMNTYLLVADVVIIACKADDIQSLGSIGDNAETDYLPMSWKKLPNHYIIVTTYSYSQASVKKHIKEGFYKYIKDYFRNEMDKIFGESCEIKVFPIEIGGSFEILCERMPEYEQEIKSTNSRILKEIKEAVKERRGSTFFSVVQRIRDESDIRKQYVKEDNEKKLEENKKRRQECEEKIKIYDEVYAKAADKLAVLKKKDKLCSDVDKILKEAKCEDINYDELSEIIKPYFRGRAKIYFKDKSPKREFFGKVGEKLRGFSQKYVKSINDKIIDSDSEGKDEEDLLLDDKAIHIDVWENVVSNGTFINNFYPIGLFKKRLSAENAINRMNEMAEKYRDEMIEVTKRSMKELIDKKRPGYELEKVRNDVLYIDNYKRKNQKNLNDIYAKIKKLEKKKQEIEENEKKDEDTFKNYMKIADKEYNKQRNSIIREINSNEFKGDEKLGRLILLGLIERDLSRIKSKGAIL